MWANRVVVPNDDGGELTGRNHTNLTKAAVSGVCESSLGRSQVDPPDEEFDLPRMGLA
jgi:hypothetical protein